MPHLPLFRAPRSRSTAAVVLFWLQALGPGSATAAVIFCGDTDADGLYETQDIQDCIDGLTGPGPHRVALTPDTTFEPHFSDASSFYNSAGFVELRSETTLDCRGSTIRGIDHLAKQSPGGWNGALSVVTNSDPVGHSQSDIWVRDCVIDGGMPAVYDEGAQPFDHDTYIGFSLDGVQRGGITGSHIHDTHHACVYIRNSKDIVVEDNQLDACGGANNQGSFSQPAVYLFQAGATVQERISVRRNRAVRSGSALYNTRISEGNLEYQTAWLRDVTIEDNFGDQQGNGKACIALRGVRGVVARGNTCVNTAGILTTGLNAAYCSENPATPLHPLAESSCLENVLIEDNILRNTQSYSGNGAVTVYGYQDGVTVRNNRVIGTERLGSGNVPCMRWETPLRNFEVDGFCATRCDAWGIEQLPSSSDQVGSPPDEAIALRNVVIQGTRLEGLLLRKRLEALTIDHLAVRDSGRGPMVVLGELVGETLTNLDFDAGPLPAGAADQCAASVPAFPLWAVWAMFSSLLVIGGVGCVGSAWLRKPRCHFAENDRR